MDRCRIHTVMCALGLAALISLLGCHGTLGAAISGPGDERQGDSVGNSVGDIGDNNTAGDVAILGDEHTAGDSRIGGDNSTGGDTAIIPWQGPQFDTTLYIDGSLTSDCVGTYDPAPRTCGGGSDTAFETFVSASSAAGAGVEFLIRAGTYNEVLHLDVSGNTTGYVGYSAYDAETVIIANVNSVDNGEDYGPIWLDHVSYNLVRGLTVQSSVGFVRAVDAHHNVIQSCNFNGSTLYPSASKRGGLYFSGSHFNRILNNRVFQGTDALALVHSNYNIVMGNAFELAGHNIFDIKCGSFNVLRNNDFTNPNQKLGSVFDCESATMSWHGNGDLAQSDAILDAAKHNLIENNTFHDTVDYYSTSGGNGIQYAGQDGIVRRNVFFQTNVGIGMAYYADEALYNYGNRIYHNVFHANYCAGISVRGEADQGRIADNEYKNNILWDNQGWDSTDDCRGTSPAQILYRSSMSGHRWVRNNIASSAGDTIIRAEFGSEYSLASFAEASVFEATLEVDPVFVNADNHQYALSEESTLNNAGHFLTTITSATGSGTSIELADASYFYDGFGIPGEEGDVVQIAGQVDTARIINVNYATNTVTLDQPLSWTEGLGFSLAYDGTAPDIGAFE